MKINQTFLPTPPVTRGSADVCNQHREKTFAHLYPSIASQWEVTKDGGKIRLKRYFNFRSEDDAVHFEYCLSMLFQCSQVFAIAHRPPSKSSVAVVYWITTYEKQVPTVSDVIDDCEALYQECHPKLSQRIA